MKEVDITMTAVLRPKLIKETLKTIVTNVVDFPIRFRLVVNIDPVGEDVNPSAIIDICKQYFKRVTYNVAPYPSFPHAVKWIWSKTRAPYILHWEDDVNILRKIDIAHMIRILENHDDISSLRLYKANTPNKKVFKTFSCIWDYNKEGFYVARDWRRQFGLNPILIKKEFIDEAVESMVDNVNPEKQFRCTQNYMLPLIKKWKYALYTKPGDGRLIDGRKGQRWKNKMKLQKPSTVKFLTWVTK